MATAAVTKFQDHDSTIKADIWRYHRKKKPRGTGSNAQANGADENKSDVDSNNQSSPLLNNKTTGKTNKGGNGKNGAAAYSGLTTQIIAHDLLKSGDQCPDCEKYNTNGKLYTHTPGVVISLHGNPIISGDKYEIEKLRCNICSNIFTPEAASDIKKLPKYTPSCAVALAINKYQLGSTFYRMDRYQKMLGIPVAKSTQWDLINELGFSVAPVFSVLEYLSAQSELTYYDDSPHKILQLPQDALRKSCRTTAILSEYNAHKIQLFYSNTNIAGENFANLLKNRVISSHLVTMTDAATSNFSKDIPIEILAKLVICFCLVHGRRNFYKIFDFFPQECGFILDCIGKVYEYEKHCKDSKLNDAARLRYHQIHSKPIMDAMRIWLVNRLKFKQEEANSALGQAISYMLNNWNALTKFLSSPGAPIDNNACERMIKISILHRKNSLFYKTTHGAAVGGMLMSIIQTAILAKINPFAYLEALHSNPGLVKRNPYLWLPWNYANQSKAA